jgi:hypothetical protein
LFSWEEDTVAVDGFWISPGKQAILLRCESRYIAESISIDWKIVKVRQQEDEIGYVRSRYLLPRHGVKQQRLTI